MVQSASTLTSKQCREKHLWKETFCSTVSFAARQAEFTEEDTSVYHASSSLTSFFVSLTYTRAIPFLRGNVTAGR